jgi:glutaredoxin-like YruB-family protein
VYTTSWCPYCKRAREYLVSKGIDFAEYDMEKDREAAARKKELHGTCGVPVAVIDGNVICGFSEEAYGKALKERTEGK